MGQNEKNLKFESLLKKYYEASLHIDNLASEGYLTELDDITLLFASSGGDSLMKILKSMNLDVDFANEYPLLKELPRKLESGLNKIDAEIACRAYF